MKKPLCYEDRLGVNFYFSLIIKNRTDCFTSPSNPELLPYISYILDTPNCNNVVIGYGEFGQQLLEETILPLLLCIR